MPQIPSTDLERTRALLVYLADASLPEMKANPNQFTAIVEAYAVAEENKLPNPQVWLRRAIESLRRDGFIHPNPTPADARPVNIENVCLTDAGFQRAAEDRPNWQRSIKFCP